MLRRNLANAGQGLIDPAALLANCWFADSCARATSRRPTDRASAARGDLYPALKQQCNSDTTRKPRTPTYEPVRLQALVGRLLDRTPGTTARARRISPVIPRSLRDRSRWKQYRGCLSPPRVGADRAQALCCHSTMRCTRAGNCSGQLAGRADWRHTSRLARSAVIDTSWRGA